MISDESTTISPTPPCPTSPARKRTPNRRTISSLIRSYAVLIDSPSLRQAALSKMNVLSATLTSVVSDRAALYE